MEGKNLPQQAALTQDFPSPPPVSPFYSGGRFSSGDGQETLSLTLSGIFCQEGK